MKNSQSKEINIIPFLITIMVLSAPILLITGIMIGNSQFFHMEFASDSISSWVTAIATAVLACLTCVLAYETWNLRLSQIRQLEELKRENIRPNVSIQLDSSSADVNFINLKISNLGKGIARKIIFRFLDIDGNEILQNKDIVIEKFRKLAIFRNGIQTLGIGQIITSFVFSFIDLGPELNGDVFKPYLNIEINFQDIEGLEYKNMFSIDFSQYEGITRLEAGSLLTITRELKKISANVASLTGKKLSVDIYDSKDRLNSN